MTLEEYKTKIEELANKYIPCDQASNMIFKFKERYKNEQDIKYEVLEAYFNYFGFDVVVQYYKSHEITFICEESTGQIVVFDDDLEKAFAHFSKLQESSSAIEMAIKLSKKESDEE